jgi:AraC-like DNA-binding protein
MNIRASQDYLEAIELHSDGVFVVHERIERKLELHFHSKGQLTFVQGGIAYIHSENVSYIIPARHYVWIPKGLLHFLEVNHTNTTIRNLYFYNFDDDKNSFYNQLGIFPVNNLLLEMIIYSEKWSGFILPGTEAHLFLSSIKNLLPMLSVESFPIALPTTFNERLRPVLLYLSQHFDDPLTLASVSKRFGFGERSLSRLFQQILSTSFLQYLKLLRTVKAIEMMIQTNKSISEIAYATGYNSIAAFSKAFYQLTNRRPKNIRNDIIFKDVNS